jgi:hypothetical protein
MWQDKFLQYRNYSSPTLRAGIVAGLYEAVRHRPAGVRGTCEILKQEKKYDIF